MSETPSIKEVRRSVRKMEHYLKDRPNDRIIDGYKKAKKDYEETQKPEIKVVLSILEKELERRHIKVGEEI